MCAKPIPKRVFLSILLVGLGLLIPARVQALSPTNQGDELSEQSVLVENETSTNTLQLVQRGTTLYEAEQFSQAAQVWQQAASAFAVQGDKLGQALALSNLSLTYQQLGQWKQARESIASSLNLLNRSGLQSHDASLILAQTLNIQGRLQLATGQSEAALETWKRAAETYKQAGDRAGVVRSLINQAQALQVLGLYSQALKTLTQVNETLDSQPDSFVKIAGLRSLGNALRVVGNLEKSQEALQASLAIAQRLGATQDIAETLLSLGNTARAKTDIPAALRYYEQAENAATATNIRLQSRLNRFSLLLEDQQFSNAEALLPAIQSDLANLPPSRTSVYACINLAQNLMKLAEEQRSRGVGESTTDYLQKSARILATAIQEAQTLNDKRAESYALGNLGTLYEQTQQFSDAESLTQQALVLAQAINAADIAYRWQWQLGRLSKRQGESQGAATKWRDRAIAAYTEAFKTLKSLRNDLVTINPEVQFSFRESVEPVYRQFVDLLLQTQSTEPSQENLAQARDVIEALQLAELDNFFRDACLNAQPVNIDQVDRKAAVIYPIILENRIEVILSLPGQPLRHYTTYISQTEVENTLSELRGLLQSSSEDSGLLLDAQKVYNWLIRPAEANLKNSKVETLVFVLDGSLRNIPMSILHDGNQYLVANYSIALTPGMQLLQPQPLAKTKLTALIAGLTQARDNFAALPNVEHELKLIGSEMRSEELLNQAFTSTAIQTEIRSSPFPVVHIATHGNFSSKAEDTFILTWDRRVNVKELDEVLRTGELNRQKPLELLVLSACETAQGDNRAALGLAGVAVRAGARSTLATLWQVSDESTALLMREFYQALNDKTITKAEALRRAQLSVLQNSEYQYPYFWAPFVLIGNWL